MTDSEKSISHRVMMALTKLGARVFRNTVGVAYQGTVTRVYKTELVKMNPGDVMVHNARTVHVGLHRGSSDLIGWIPLKGRAIFLACEVKSQDGRATPEQENFLHEVGSAGGIAMQVRSVEQAEAIIRLHRGQ